MGLYFVRQINIQKYKGGCEGMDRLALVSVRLLAFEKFTGLSLPQNASACMHGQSLHTL